jgi:hypothetical protein
LAGAEQYIAGGDGVDLFLAFPVLQDIELFLVDCDKLVGIADLLPGELQLLIHSHHIAFVGCDFCFLEDLVEGFTELL